MTEMLERLAKALGDVAYGYVDRVATPNKWDTAMALARVAVETMRVPTEAMLVETANACCKRPAQDDDSDTTFVWQAMIEAAGVDIDSPRGDE